MGDLPNRSLVVYALAILGGESRPVHTEEIAVKCHELFGKSFSWTRYPQYPDKDIVRVALTDARKSQWGGLVEGRAGEKRGLSAKTKRGPAPDGWRLTAAGVRWLEQNRQLLESQVGEGDINRLRQRVQKQLAKVRSHPLFVSFLQSPQSFAPSIGEVADFLRCRVDAPRVIWERRFADQERTVPPTDQAMRNFIAKCHDAYLAEYENSLPRTLP